MGIARSAARGGPAGRTETDSAGDVTYTECAPSTDGRNRSRYLDRPDRCESRGISARRTVPESIDADERDEAARLRAERDFWRSLFAQLVEAFPEGAFAVSAGGEITNWNPAMEESNGTAADAVLGENAYVIFQTEGQEETLAETVVRRNEPVQEADTRTVPDSDRYYRVYAVPLRDPNGDPVGAFEATPDVSEFVHQRRAYEELQETVSERVRAEVVDLESTAESIAESIDRIRELGVEETERMEMIATEVSNQSATIEEIASTTTAVQGTSADAAELAEDGSEAAGAGEEGAGFAVVASEVKSLAEQTQEQAGRIESTIEEIQTEMDGTAESLDRTTDRIDDGVDRVEGALERLDEIAAVVDDVARGVDEVANAIDDQSAGSEEIAATVDTAVEEMNALRDELESIADATQEQRESVSTVRSTVGRLSELDD